MPNETEIEAANPHAHNPTPIQIKKCIRSRCFQIVKHFILHLFRDYLNTHLNYNNYSIKILSTSQVVAWCVTQCTKYAQTDVNVKGI